MLFILVISLMTFPVISADEVVSSQVAYCEHMGYNLEINNVNNLLFCVFDNLEKCDATEFYNGECGQERVKEFPLRKNGEFVYIEFEKCEDGLWISEPEYLLDLPKCKEYSIFSKILNWFFD